MLGRSPVNARRDTLVRTRMMLRKLLLPVVLGVLGTVAPAVAAPREPVRPVVKAKKATASTGKLSGARGKKLVAKAPAPSKKKKKPVPLTKGRRVARRAGSLVGVPLAGQGQVPDDCSGLVRAAYHAVGIELLSHGTLPGENAVSAIYRRAQRAGALRKRDPKPGDLVFFHETYDRNRDGLRNDGLTHIGVIEGVERDGTVVFVHRGGDGVKRSRMNLRLPTQQRTKSGQVLNDYIRRAEGGERARLSSELFSGFASAVRL
ncbi:MAG TPA: NlpC/P60 family protein [Archangium sp.]|uniref:NlpC/P60 family protein n=1 Tax=Archangium sp. TaxID=1872627 RepID=UPI002ED81814